MEKKISKKEKSIKKSKNNNQQSSINNLLFGVNKSISKEKNIKDEIKEPIKEEKLKKNKNEIICELKLKCKKLEKEIEIYAKKSIEELKITEKIKMKNINELKTKLNILKEKLQLELNIKYPNISEVEPLISFEEIQSVLKYRNNFTEIMKNIYKYEYPTSIQSISIPLINENKNIIAISETGSGKTLSYIIPFFIDIIPYFS